MLPAHHPSHEQWQYSPLASANTRASPVSSEVEKAAPNCFDEASLHLVPGKEHLIVVAVPEHVSCYNGSFPDLPTAVKGSVPGLVAKSQRRLVACKLTKGIRSPSNLLPLISLD